MNKYVGTTFDDFLVEAGALLDEQGDFWPPEQTPLARVKMYGGDPSSEWNGQIVQVDWFDYESDLFECVAYDRLDGAPLLCKREELLPLNEYTKALLEVMPEACGPTEETIFARRALARAGKLVPVDVIEAWDHEQISAALHWAVKVNQGESVAVPPELAPY
jgi:hypothetical protein